MEKKTIIGIALAVMLSLSLAGLVYATGSYSTVVVPSVKATLGHYNTIACDLKPATGPCAISFQLHSSTGILKAREGKDAPWTNLTTVTATARATHKYITRQPYKDIFMDFTSISRKGASNRDQKASFVWY
jgi:hypothetical protein